jgi:hypothetical protein
MNQQAITIAIRHNVACLIDEEDLELVSRFIWFADRRKFVAYAKTLSRRVNTTMHRLVMKAKKGQQVDHINGDGLDNRKQNLKLSTGSSNQQNAHNKRRSISGYRGVYPSSNNKWRTQLTHKKKRYHLGVYETTLEAAIAYDNAADSLYGPFGYRNFPTLVSKESAIKWLKNAGGKFFSVGFYKREYIKSFRLLTGRKCVTKYSNGGSLRFNPEKRDLINVYDMVHKCYRFINLRSLVFLVNEGVEKRVVQSKI